MTNENADWVNCELQHGKRYCTYVYNSGYQVGLAGKCIETAFRFYKA